MNFNNPIPRTGLPSFQEGSRLRSPRDGDAVPRVWQKTSTASQQLYRTAQAVEQLQRQLNRLRKRKGGDSEGEAMPFEIYQSATWLKFKVKTGWVIKTGNPIIPTAVEAEFELTAGVARYWFYLDLSDDTIKISDTTLSWDVDLIPIGWVDTETDEDDEVSTVYQFVRDHIFIPCA
jgi:hypothetical protein